MRKYFLLILMLLVSSGCVYFNTFYNAEQSFKDALKIIEESPDSDEELPSNAKIKLGKAIEKSQLVIEKYPESKYVDDAIYIIGKASFLRNEIGTAERYFTRLIHNYPQSPFASECEIWLAYTHFRLGNADSARIEIETIMQEEHRKRSDQYLMNLVMGEIELDQDSLQAAFRYYEKAAQLAESDGRKASIYNKLVKLAEENGDQVTAIPFLEQVEIYATTPKIKEEAKLKWLRYNRKAGNYDLVATEIETMLASDEYESIRLQLELQQAKVSMDRLDFNGARTELEEIVDDPGNKRKAETAEAAFHLGRLFLIQDFDLDNAVVFFDSVARISSRSPFKSRATDLANKIERYENLDAEFYKSAKKYKEELLNPPSEQPDSLETVVEPDTTVAEADSVQTEKKDPEASQDAGILPLEPAEEKLGAPDSLLFIISELLLFEFEQTSKALDRYGLLVTDYPESRFTPQSLYILSEYSGDGKWVKQLEEQFPESIYLKRNSGDLEEDTDPLDAVRDEAWRLLHQPDSALTAFERIAGEHDDPVSGYAAAFIRDEYLYQPEEAILAYQAFVEKYPGHALTERVTSRLDDLKQGVQGKMDEVVGLVPGYVQKITIDQLEEKMMVMVDADTVFSGISDTLKLFTNVDTTLSIFKEKMFVFGHPGDSVLTHTLHLPMWLFALNNSLIYQSHQDSMWVLDDVDSLTVAIPVKSYTYYPEGNQLRTMIWDSTPVPHPDLEPYAELLGLADTLTVPEEPDSLESELQAAALDTALSAADQVFADAAVSDSVVTEVIAGQDTAAVNPDDEPGEIIPETLPEIIPVSEVIPPVEVDLPRTDTLSEGSADIPEETRLDSVIAEEIDATPPDDAAAGDAEPAPELPSGEAETDSASQSDIALQTGDAPADPAAVWQEYIVHPGEYLTGIAVQEYGSYHMWAEIYQWNQAKIGSDPNYLKAFTILDLKGDKQNVFRTDLYTNHTVLSGESLWKIAADNYGDGRAWRILVNDNPDLMNQEDGLLQPGLNLKIRKQLD